MRLEQLVLYGPGDDDRLRFGPRYTVFSGLGPDDRRELIDTVVRSLTGQLPNASVVYSDVTGRRVFADRTGATYADSGTIAPGPKALLGNDPDAVAGMLTVSETDLGLGPSLSAADVSQQLGIAREDLEKLHVEHVEVAERAKQVELWKAEVDRLDALISSADEDAARWTWVEQRRRLDEARAELAMVDRDDDGETDENILSSVNDLRTAGEEWTDLAARASERVAALGSIPKVSPEDLARVAATPDQAPPSFGARLDAWRAAIDAHRAACAERTEATAVPDMPSDPLVVAFAQVDQTQLWAAHAGFIDASRTYETLAAELTEDGHVDQESENAVESAHLQVVRAQRHVDRSFQPGALGTGALAVTALLTSTGPSVPAGALLLVAAVAVAWWALLMPRRALTSAERDAQAALAQTDASSWLGLQLHRHDHPTDLGASHGNGDSSSDEADHVELWRVELERLNSRVALSDEDAARWIWVEQHHLMESARSELAMLDGRSTGEVDEQPVDRRAKGPDQPALAPIPDLSPEHLVRACASPDELPPNLAARVEAWRAAVDAHREANAEPKRTANASQTPSDPVVAAFSQIDQSRLSAANDAFIRGSGQHQAPADLSMANGWAHTERTVEAAHIKVERAQHRVRRASRPGGLVVGAMVVLAILTRTGPAVPASAALLVAALVMAWWLLITPRQALAQAEEDERSALSHTDATSWLGLHLRRLDAVTDGVERKRFERAANERARALVDWEEVAGVRSPEELSERAEAVRAFALANSPQEIARRDEETRVQCETTASAVKLACRSVHSGLERYGIPESAALDQEPEALLQVLKQRIEAGRLARRAKEHADLRLLEADAAKRLDGLLRRLGFASGALEGRLERAIQSVTTARQRQAFSSGTRGRSDIEADMARLARIVASTARPSWSATSEPAAPPMDPDVLEARRLEISELIAAGSRPDVVGAERRYQLGLTRVRDLESRIGEIAAGPGSMGRRLATRLARTAWLNGEEETMPVFIDNAFSSLPVEERLHALDVLVDLSEKTQVVLLSDDPLVARWARDRVGHVPLTLFEAERSAQPGAGADRTAPRSAMAVG